MNIKLNAEQQAFVDNANRLTAEAAVSGHPPSEDFVSRCNSEAGVPPAGRAYALEDPPEYPIPYVNSMQPAISRAEADEVAKALESPFTHPVIGERMRPRIIVVKESDEFPPNRTVAEHLRRYYEVKVLEAAEIAGAVRGEQRIELYEKGEDMPLGWFVKLEGCDTYQWTNVYGSHPTGKAFTREMLLNTGYQEF